MKYFYILNTPLCITFYEMKLKISPTFQRHDKCMSLNIVMENRISSTNNNLTGHSYLQHGVSELSGQEFSSTVNLRYPL